MNAKFKLGLNAVINIGANLLILGVIPLEYKGWALMVFNIAQVVYAYLDPSYAMQQLGMSKKQFLGAVEDAKK